MLNKDHNFTKRKKKEHYRKQKIRLANERIKTAIFIWNGRKTLEDNKENFMAE